MGNHSAGRAMGKTTALLLKSSDRLPALDILDVVCEPYRQCDAEFEAEDPERPGRIHPDYTRYTDPHGPMGMLILEVWGEDGEEYMESVEGVDYQVPSEAWYEGPYQKFRDRYDFR